MGRTRRALLVVGLLAGTLVATVVPTAPAGSAPVDAVGFTTLRTEAGCELQRVDMATGQLTDLPAPPLPEACVVDLAAAPDGQVYGVVSGFSSVPDEPGLLSLVTFGSDGTPVLDDLPILGGGGYTGGLGALAISPDGTFYVMGNYVVPGDPQPTYCVPGAVFYCLYTLDPVTLAVTPLGGEGGMDTEYQWLTYCTSGLFAAVVSSGTAIAALDPDTGLFLPYTGPPGPQPYVRGFDCAVGSDTLYAINGPVVKPEVADQYPPIPPETPLTIVTLDLTTNTYTRIAELSSPTAVIYNLAVVAVPPGPSTTTTTSGGVAADEVVTAPAFTG